MRRLYAIMQGCRSHITHRSRLAAGIEAIVAGALSGLLPEDALTTAEGGSTVGMALQMSSSSENTEEFPLILECGSHDGRLALSSATHIATSVGVALTKQAQGEGGIVLALCGDTPSLSDAREALRFAAHRKLPLVVVTEHNMARVKAASHSGGKDVVHAARALGVPAMSVDGTDAMAVYRVTQEALYRARHGRGPTMIECKTWRPREGKATLPPPRVRHWVQGDPLEYMERQMRARGFWSDTQ